MKVIEIFSSRQGEGIWTGVRSTFIRIGGCNLRCRFCDTTYASWRCESGEDLDVEEITGWAVLYQNPHVVVTGGEPMLFGETVQLTKLLAARGFVVTIETNGTCDLPVECDLMSISPKMSNSVPRGTLTNFAREHDDIRFRPDVVRVLASRYRCQLKFVVGSEEDIREIDEYIAMVPNVAKNHVLLMPMATNAETMHTKGEWIKVLCEDRGYSYCPRMHLEWYGGARGK